MNDVSSSRSSARTGRFLLLLGMLGLALLLMAAADGLPVGLRQAIVENSAIWGACSGALVIAGIRLLWNLEHGRTTWRPAQPGRRFQTILVYSRKQCGLCEEAIELLSQYRDWLPIPMEIDIDEIPELREKYDQQVPVVEIDGRIRFRGCIREVLLQRLIEGTSPILPLRRR